MIIRVTDKPLLRRRLSRAHRRGDQAATFLIDRVVDDMAERLRGVERWFGTAVAFGGQSDRLAQALLASGRVETVFRLEQTEAAFREARIAGAVADEEALPIGAASIDLFASALALQWTNDLPGALVQVRRALRPDGLFLAAMTGGETLMELREALVAAETELRGGASPRVTPQADIRELGALLQRAGLQLPVADRDRLTVRYKSAFDLYFDLQRMGATNALAQRERRPGSRRLLVRAAEIYAERFSDPDGRVRATFEVISLSGWAEHESQQKPARRGSARAHLAEALKPSRSHS
ncbi:MAG TPA: methyltransferase domain-containing protein [Propylenella sp.]